MFGKREKEPAKEIPANDPTFLALQVEMAKLRAQQEVTQLLMRVLQSQYNLPDGASLDANGRVRLP